jgi:hypothetical protein
MSCFEPETETNDENYSMLMAFVVYRIRVFAFVSIMLLAFQGGTTCKSGILPLDPLIRWLVEFGYHGMSLIR